MIRALTFTLLLGLPVFLPGADMTGSLQRAEQNRPAASADEQEIFKPESVSPYIIEWYIDINEDADLNHIRRSLNLKIRNHMSFRCGGGCTAETFDIQVADAKQNKTVALKISFERGDFHQFLFFKRENSDSTGSEKWRFIGDIASYDQRHGPPKHRIESGDDRTWFVVRELWGQGSGAIAYGETWHEIKQSELREVLRYPVEGHDIPCRRQLGRSYKSILIRHGLANGTYTIPVQFLVSYNMSECDGGNDSPPLFAKAQKAYYVWSGEKERFVLDTLQSDIAEKEISSVYNIEGLSREQFVEHNFSELSDIARRGDAEQKDWLRQFLIGMQDSPRKTALQKAFRQ